MNQTLVGVFDDHAHAKMARDELMQSGFSAGAVHLHGDSSGMTSAERDQYAGSTQHEGGISGFFKSLFGFDDDDASISAYGEATRRGHCLVSIDVDSDSEMQRAQQILERHRPIDIDERAAQWRSEGWTGGTATTEASTGGMASEAMATSGTRASSATDSQGRIPVVQEELHVGKRTVQAGGIRVYTRVREIPIEERVQLREEHAHVERRAVDRPATEADFAAMKEGTLEVRESIEQPVIAKEARVVEEVEVGKDVRERTQTVRDKVRKTEVEVENLGEHATARGTVGDTPTSAATSRSSSTAGKQGDSELSVKTARAADKVENAVERAADKVTGRSTTTKR